MIGADRADQLVPAAARLEQRGGRRIGLLRRRLRRRAEEFVLRLGGSRAVGQRKADRQRGPLQGGGVLSMVRPCASATVDPGIAVGRMQPAAAEIEREAGRVGDGPGAAAEPRPRLDDQAIDGGLARSRRPAAMPAAPPPMITTSVSLFAIRRCSTLIRRRRDRDNQ